MQFSFLITKDYTAYNLLINLILNCKFYSSKEYQDLKSEWQETPDKTSNTITVEKNYGGEFDERMFVICPGKLTEVVNKIKELWGKEVLEIGV